MIEDGEMMRIWDFFHADSPLPRAFSKTLFHNVLHLSRAGMDARSDKSLSQGSKSNSMLEEVLDEQKIFWSASSLEEMITMHLSGKSPVYVGRRVGILLLLTHLLARPTSFKTVVTGRKKS